MSKENIITNSESLLLSQDNTFFTIQGEGTSIGKPVVFLRLNACNLHCGFCDTAYTWNGKEKSESTKIDDLTNTLNNYPCKRLVITGGEPLLQNNNLDKLINKLPDWKFEIETNGTILPTRLMIEKGVQINCSPKLENSGNEKELRYKPEVLKFINQLSNSNFKFVVTCPDDILEIEQIVKECNIDNDKIILMPEGIDQDAIREHALQVIDFCKEKGWRLIPRLQVMLYGNTRKV